LEQLTAMGWRYVAGNLAQPTKTGRASFVSAKLADFPPLLMVFPAIVRK